MQQEFPQPVPLFLSLISNCEALSLSPRESFITYPFELFRLWPDDGLCLRLTNSKSLIETSSPSPLFNSLSSYFCLLRGPNPKNPPKIPRVQVVGRS